MSVAKIGAELTTGVKDFGEQLALMDSGKIFIGEGFYAEGAADSVFANQAAAASELASNLDEMSDLAENPGNYDSSSKSHKTKNYVIAGKRTTKITINLAGLSQARKDWLEQELNTTNKTIVLQSSDLKHYMIFNGLRFKCDWKGDFDGIPTVPITAEFDGATATRIMFYTDLAVGP